MPSALLKNTSNAYCSMAQEKNCCQFWMSLMSISFLSHIQASDERKCYRQQYNNQKKTQQKTYTHMYKSTKYLQRWHHALNSFIYLFSSPRFSTIFFFSLKQRKNHKAIFHLFICTHAHWHSKFVSLTQPPYKVMCIVHTPEN